MEQKLLNKLNSKLQPTEELLWYGRPEAFEFKDKTHTGPLKAKAIKTILVGIVVILGYIMAAINYQADIKLPFIAILAAFVAFILLDNQREAKKLQTKVMYGLTNERMLTVVGDCVFSVDYSAIHGFKFVTDEDGHTSLLVGKTAMHQPAHMWRTATVIGTTLNQETGVCDNYAMYALPEVEPVKAIMKQYAHA